MLRLESKLPELVQRLRNASWQKQRNAAIAACQLALAKSKIEDQLVLETFEKLRRFERPQAVTVTRLTKMVAKLDDRYLEMQYSDESLSGNSAMKLLLFSQARAVSALLFALHDNPFEAAAECIYEAFATGDSESELRDLLEAVLR